MQHFRTVLGILLAGAAAASGQHISPGIKIGTPLTNLFSDQNSNAVDVVTRIVSDSTKIIVGPMLEVRLPLGLAIEADALYRPLGYSLINQVIPQPTTVQTAKTSVWQFPVLGKFRVPFPIVHPYVEAGPSFRRFGGIVDGFWSNKGFTMGAGAEVKIVKLRIAPELRYTRWGSDPKSSRPIIPLSDQNQAEFLVGFSF